MSDVTEDEFIDIGTRMAQELQDFVDDATAAAGEPALQSVRELIDEWDAIYVRAETWQQKLAESSDITSKLKEL